MSAVGSSSRWWWLPWRRRDAAASRAAVRASGDARAALEAARADRPRVREVAERAERLRARNGFAEAILRTMGGGR